MTNKTVSIQLTEDEIEQLIMAINYYFEESGTFDETLDVSLRYCHEKFAERIPDEEGNLVYYYKDLWGNLSAQANWYPIENLRVQGCAGIRTGMPYIMAGATYTFDFKLW